MRGIKSKCLLKRCDSRKKNVIKKSLSLFTNQNSQKSWFKKNNLHNKVFTFQNPPLSQKILRQWPFQVGFLNSRSSKTGFEGTKKFCTLLVKKVCTKKQQATEKAPLLPEGAKISRFSFDNVFTTLVKPHQIANNLKMLYHFRPTQG